MGRGQIYLNNPPLTAIGKCDPQPQTFGRMPVITKTTVNITATGDYPMEDSELKENVVLRNAPTLKGKGDSISTPACYGDDDPLCGVVSETLGRHSSRPSKNTVLSSPYYVDKKLTTILLLCSLVTPAQASIGGDNWANNLFSDLAPILALFGEQVAKQFLSDSSGLADSVLFAMAPLGVITGIVSAIRVAGHPWLKALVGRGKEGVAQAELELMSSNSHDVGEMYNGEAIVRVLGTPSVFQFVYAAENLKACSSSSTPNSTSHHTAEREQTAPGSATHSLPINTPSNTNLSRPSSQSEYQAPKAPGQGDAAAPPSEAASRYENPFVNKIGILDDKNHFFQLQHPRVQSEPSEVHPTLNVVNESQWNDNYDIEMPLLRLSQRDQTNLDRTSEDNSPPNMSLNARGEPISALEKTAMASVAVVIQLAVLIFQGFISYHPSLKGHFLKDDLSPSRESFPCTAIGTMALNLGMFICSYVIDRATTEETWVLKKGLCNEDAQNCRVCWVQKGATVNDQVFAPYLIFGDKSQQKIRTSHRCHKGRKVEVELHLLVLLGTIISVVGFVTQFVGLRGMNWSASIAQLGATAIATAIRSLVRRRMTREPDTIRAVEGYELDCMARKITLCSGWKVAPVVLWDIGLDDKPSVLCNNTLAVRKRLGDLSNWESDTENISGILCSAMEKTINFLHRSKEIVWIGSAKTDCSLEWHLPVMACEATENSQRVGSSGPEGRARIHYANLPFTLSRPDRRGTWKVDKETKSYLASILSLWKLSFAEEEAHHRTGGTMPEKIDLSDTHPAVKALSWPRHAGDRELFKMWMGSHDLDIRSSLSSSDPKEMPMHRVVGRLGIKGSRVPDDLTLVVFPAASMKRLFSQEIFSIYLSAITCHIRDILGSVERIPHENRIDTAEFRHSTLSQLIATLSETGLGNHQEIQLLILAALGENDILPLGDNATQIDIVEHIRIGRPFRTLALRNEWGRYASEIIRLTLSIETEESRNHMPERYEIQLLKQFWIRILSTLDKKNGGSQSSYERLFSTKFRSLIQHSYRSNSTEPVETSDLPTQDLNELEHYFSKKVPFFKSWWRDMRDHFGNRDRLLSSNDSPESGLDSLLKEAASVGPDYDLKLEALAAQIMQIPVSETTFDTVLVPAASGGHYHVLELLSNHIYTRFPNWYMQPKNTQIPMLFFKAVLPDSPEVPKLLTRLIPKREVVDYRQAALIHAASRGNCETVSAFLKDGASINGCVNAGRYDQILFLPVSGEEENSTEIVKISPRKTYSQLDADFCVQGDYTKLLLSGGQRTNWFRDHHDTAISELLANGSPREAAAAISARTALEAVAGAARDRESRDKLEPIVDLLLRKGAEADPEPERWMWPSALQHAAGSGNLYMVSKLLKREWHRNRRADINRRANGYFGRTALQAAAGGDHVDVLKNLLKLGADPNEPLSSFGGRTALQAAVEATAESLSAEIASTELEESESSEMSLDHWPAVEATAESEESELIEIASAESEESESSEMSLDHWPAVEAMAESEESELIEIASAESEESESSEMSFDHRWFGMFGHGAAVPESVEMLLDHGAAVLAGPAPVFGLTAIQAAAGTGNLALLNKMIKTYTDALQTLACTRYDTDTDTPATATTASRSRKDLDICAVNEAPSEVSGRTALQAASQHGHIAVVDRLLELGADVNAPPSKRLGLRALQAAALGGHKGVVKRLLKAKAEVDALPAPNEGLTALQAASSVGHLGIVNCLLDLKASVVDSNRTTALEHAASGGHTRVFDRLVAAGAISGANDDQLRRVTTAAARGGHLDIMERLMRTSDAGNINRTLRIMIEDDAPDWAEDSDPDNPEHDEPHNPEHDEPENPEDDEPTIPLVAAAEGGCLEMVDYLLKSRAPGTRYRGAALRAASAKGHWKVVEKLWEHVESAFTGDHVGAALVGAMSGGHIEIATELFRSCASHIGEIPTHYMGKALRAAAGRGQLEMVTLFLELGAQVNEVGDKKARRTALQAAAASGHLPVIERLLAAGADPNADSVGPYGRRALQAAAEGGHIPVVERLLTAGANVNADPADYHGRTALQAAAEGGNLPVVERLLTADANVNADPGREYGRTALQAAAEGGHIPVVERLLSAGANVNADPGRKYGRTALQAAAEGGHLQVVESLLTAGANVNADPADYHGRTALQAAAGGGHLQVAGCLLMAGANVNADPGTWGGQTALQAAAEGGHLPVVEFLLTAGANVNKDPGGEYGRTALQRAAEGGHIPVVERLLITGANVNADPGTWGRREALQRIAEGGHLPVVGRPLTASVKAGEEAWYERTALQAAAKGGHLQVLQRLLTAGANINADPGTWGGRTALQAAAEGGHLPMVEFLLTAGANVNADPAAWGGRTALHAAVEGGHLPVVERLLTAGANVNADPGAWGWRTAVQAAAERGHLPVVERLLTAGASVNADPADYHGRTALQAAAGGGHLQVVERLLTAGANVNADPAAWGGQTALQAAAEGGYLPVVERLLTAGANVNADPGKNYGRTALQAAAEGGHLQVVECLLTAGANVNAGSEWLYGRTALQAAAEGGHPPVVERLLTAGANVDAKPAVYHGRTALQAAAGGGHLPVVERLLTAGANVDENPGGSFGRTALQAAAGGGHLPVVERLLTVGANVDADPADYHGRTALQAAAEGGHLPVVERLLTAGANVNADPADYHGRTALQAAAGGGHLPVVQRLLTAGANVDAIPADHHGRTALQAAAGGGHLPVVERLLTASANVNAHPAWWYGRTALQASAEDGHLPVFERLLAAGADAYRHPPVELSNKGLSQDMEQRMRAAIDASKAKRSVPPDHK